MFKCDTSFNYALAKHSGKIPVNHGPSSAVFKDGSYALNGLFWEEFLPKGQKGFECYVDFFDNKEEAFYELTKEEYKPVCYKEQTPNGEVWNITEYVAVDNYGFLLDFRCWEIDEETEKLVLTD